MRKNALIINEIALLKMIKRNVSSIKRNPCVVESKIYLYLVFRKRYFFHFARIRGQCGNITRKYLYRKQHYFSDEISTTILSSMISLNRKHINESILRWEDHCKTVNRHSLKMNYDRRKNGEVSTSLYNATFQCAEKRKR